MRCSMKRYSNYLRNMGNGCVDVLVIATRLIRPLFGIAGTCRYTVTCSAYTRYVLRNFSLRQACWLSIKRIACCAFFIRR